MPVLTPVTARSTSSRAMLALMSACVVVVVAMVAAINLALPKLSSSDLRVPIGVLAVSRRSVAIARRVGARATVTGGMVLVAAGLAALSFVTSKTAYLPYGLALLAVSTGMGLSVPTLSTGIMASLPAARAGMGSGLNSAAREIGSALGVAVVGAVLTSHFAKALPAALQDRGGSTSQTLSAAQQLGRTSFTQAVNAFTDAMATGYRVIALVVLIAAILAAPGLGRRPA